MIWLIFGLLAILAVVFATWPLWRRGGVAAGRRRIDVYRAQLREIELEATGGLLAPGAAAAARLEVERRLLRAAQHADDRSEKNVSGLVLIATALVAVAGAAALYGRLGAPALDGQPYQPPGYEGLSSDDGGPTLNQLVDHLLVHLAENPDAGQGWEHLRRAAPLLGRETDWARALTVAIAARPEDLTLRIHYVESLLVMGRGQMTPAARLALAQAMALDADAPPLRYYQALALLQDGKAGQAEAIWRGLLAEARGDPDWMRQLERQIAEAARQQGRMPDAGAAQAILDLPPEEQAAQIRAMVDGLAARLETEPENGAGWLRLARAYRVLGEAEKSDAAYGRALGLARQAGDAEAADAITAEMNNPS